MSFFENICQDSLVSGDVCLRELELKITQADDGRSGREIMKNRFELSSREITRCKQFDDGVMVKRDGESEYVPMMIKDALHTGDVLRIRIYENTEGAEFIVPWDTGIDIVYEDQDIIVLNKGGDMVVHPSYAHYTDSLSNALAGYYKRTGQRHLIRAIGRLDRETSGLVLFAKNRHSAAVLSNQSGRMSRRKEYLALASGIFDVSEGVVDAPIERRDDSRMIRQVRADGKEAITHYRVEKQYDNYALIRLRLDTGRTHQIRVHMAYIGHPLLGDTLYGKEIPDNLRITRTALHAGILELDHPITKKRLWFEAPIPEDMRRLL